MSLRESVRERVEKEETVIEVNRGRRYCAIAERTLVGCVAVPWYHSEVRKYDPFSIGGLPIHVSAIQLITTFPTKTGPK